MRLPDDWDRFMDGLPPNPPAPSAPAEGEEVDLEDEGPLLEAKNLADCIEDQLVEARESINLAFDLLGDLRRVLESGELHESGSDACKDAEEE